MKSYKLILVLILLIAFALRFYKISENPPGLYIDEVAIGHNAYQILTTGKDEHNESFPLFFKSFGDYKMPIYIYSTSISMAIFGKNEFAVRFPSVFLGTLTVLILYLFVKKLLEISKSNNKESIGLFSSFLLAISPWHLQFSRGGFETTAALFIFMLGFVLFLYFLDKKKYYLLVLSSVFFSASIYTYHSYRIISPIVFISLCSYLFVKFPGIKRKIFFSFLTFFLLSLPILLFSFSPEGSSRFSATSVFSELGRLNLMEKLLQYPMALLKNYLSYFSFYFLFDTGDGIGRHQLPNFGPMFKWQLAFVVVGLFALIKNKSKMMKAVILGLLILAPIPASIAVPSPHTLRSFLMVIPLTFLTAFGAFYVFQRLMKLKKQFIIALSLVIIFELIFYLHHYYIHYPQVNQLDWGSGYKEVVLKTVELKSDFDELIIDENLDFSDPYYKFYSEDSPPQHVKVSWNKPNDWKNKRVLYVRPYYGPQNSKEIIYNVYFPYSKDKIFAQFWKL